MNFTTRQKKILRQIGSDQRLPHTALGYLDNLSECAPEILADRLVQLSRYVPELVSQFRRATARPGSGRRPTGRTMTMFYIRVPEELKRHLASIPCAVIRQELAKIPASVEQP